jgi:hypothetical protein
MMLAAPELVVAQPVEMGDEIQIALELQRGILPDGMVRRQESAEFDAVHRQLLGCEKGEGSLEPG